MVSVDRSWMPTFLNRRKHGVIAATRLSRQETTIKTINYPDRRVTIESDHIITGGVEIDVTFDESDDQKQKVVELTKSVRKSLEKFPGQMVFPVSHAKQTYKGFIVPISMAGILKTIEK